MSGIGRASAGGEPPPIEEPAHPADGAPAQPAPIAGPRTLAVPAGPVRDLNEAVKLAVATFAGSETPDPALTGETIPFGVRYTDVVIHRRSSVKPFPIVERNLAVMRVDMENGTVRKLGAADEFLAKNEGALGWKPQLPLTAWRVETDKSGYTRVCYREPLDDATWNAIWNGSVDTGKLDPAAIRSVGSAHLVFGPDGRLVDAGASLRDLTGTWWSRSPAPPLKPPNPAEALKRLRAPDPLG